MGLLPQRMVRTVDTGFFMTQKATRGSIVSHHSRRADIAILGGHSPIGVLSVDVVDIDLTREWINPDIALPLGSRVEIITEGWVMLKIGKIAYPLGHPVYADKNGRPTVVQWGPAFGTLISKPNRQGYAKVSLR